MLFLTFSKMLRLHPALDHVPGAFPARQSPVYRFGLALPGCTDGPMVQSNIGYHWNRRISRIFGWVDTKGWGIKWNGRYVTKMSFGCVWLGFGYGWTTKHENMTKWVSLGTVPVMGPYIRDHVLKILVNDVEEYTLLTCCSSFFLEVPFMFPVTKLYLNKTGNLHSSIHHKKKCLQTLIWFFKQEKQYRFLQFKPSPNS